MSESIYLRDIPLEKAISRLTSALKEINQSGVLGVEPIRLDEDAVGRVLAEPIWAKISSPHYHASAMDGFAVYSSETAGAMLNAPVILNCGLENGKTRASYLDTGDPLPEWADAVIPIENVEPLGRDNQPATNPRKPYAIRIRSAIAPWSHVRPMGEDIVATQLVLPSGHVLRPVDLGATAACGHDHIKVTRKVRVAILPTGTELMPIGSDVKAGEIIEYNSLVLAAQVETWGGVANRFPITPDNFDLICKQVLNAAEDHDLILVNAGSSAGSEDFSAKVVEALGELLVHGVAVRPGHPVIIGVVRVPESDPTRYVPIIGVPGFPVSAALTGEIFVEPLIARWMGRAAYQPVEIEAKLTRKVTSPAGDDDYMRVAVGRVGDQYLAAPLARGSGVITSLVRADGITIIPRGSQGKSAGEMVKVRLYRSQDELNRTIFVVGSHDISLDVMAQFLALKQRRLSSANVGSLGGMIALSRKECHFAGSHLLDPITGSYNLSYIHDYLPGIPVKIISLVGRDQGLMVRKGNPLGIHSFEDLARPEITFINRQRGAGTRVLLDYQLEKMGLDVKYIHGYEHEEYTHLAVAAAIASGRADCGLGIAAAASALNLEFISLFQEPYELIVPSEYYQDELLIPMWEVLSDHEFQTIIASMPGYDVSDMGRIVAEIN